MSDFDALLEIRKNLLEELLRDSEDLKIDVKAIVESKLNVIKKEQTKSLENTKQYKAFVESVKKKLTLDNTYVQEFEPERDTYEEVDDEAYPYRMSDEEALEKAVDGLLNDNLFKEFITEEVPEFVDLLKLIIERAR